MLTITGTGLPEPSNWTCALGILRWGAGTQAHLLMGQDSVSGREMMNPLSSGSVTLPEITSTIDLRAFLGSVTSFSFAGVSAILSNLVGSLSEDDHVSGTADADRFSLGIGHDTVYGGARSNRVWGGADDDSLNGEAGNEAMTGGLGRASRYGGAGDAGSDVFVLNLTSSAAQATTANGGSGVDRVIFGTFDTVSDIPRGAAGLTITGGEGGRVTFTGIEEFQMGGFGVMTADAFFDFWVDVLP